MIECAAIPLRILREWSTSESSARLRVLSIHTHRTQAPSCIRSLKHGGVRRADEHPGQRKKPAGQRVSKQVSIHEISSDVRDPEDGLLV